MLKKNPDFQTAHPNKGIFLSTEASDAKDRGDEEKGDDFLAQARVAFQKAVCIDHTSDPGKRAAEPLQNLRSFERTPV